MQRGETGDSYMNKRETGTKYEQKAAEYLEACGYRILEANYRCRAGEIDLIAAEDGYETVVSIW